MNPTKYGDEEENDEFTPCTRRALKIAAVSLLKKQITMRTKSQLVKTTNFARIKFNKGGSFN